MRYLIIIVLALVSSLITSSVSPQLPILGAECDLLLVVMLSMELNEKTLTPVIACSVAAVFTDAFFAPAIGFYSFPYLAVGMAVYALLRRVKLNPLYGPAAVCAAAWLAKDLLSAMLSFFLGNTFDFFYIFFHSTLPGALVNAVFIFLIFPLISLIYKNAFMAPRTSAIKDEFPEMKSFQRQRRRPNGRQV